jgi:hypothetical protein
VTAKSSGRRTPTVDGETRTTGVLKPAGRRRSPERPTFVREVAQV